LAGSQVREFQKRLESLEGLADDELPELNAKELQFEELDDNEYTSILLW